MERTVICPCCGHAVPYRTGETRPCPHCGGAVSLRCCDFQNVEFDSVNDGHHSWYSQPTAVHDVYRCRSYPLCCPGCVHWEGPFCKDGWIDIRVERKEQSGRVRYRWDGGSRPYCRDESTASPDGKGG